MMISQEKNNMRFKFIQGDIMRRIFSLRYFFCLNPKSYQKYLNSHIKKSLQNVSTPNKIKCKLTCQTYFQKLCSALSQYNQSQIPTKINMIFSAAFQLQNFDQQRELICQMIFQGKIRSQSELDRILKFLFKEIKWNANIGQRQMQKFLEDLEIKTEEFKKEINKDFLLIRKEFVDKNLNALCKKYREKYPEIDSKQVFDEVISKIKQVKSSNISNEENHLSSSSTFSQTEQNKFWDKINKIKPRLIKQQLNSAQIVQDHKKITQGRLRFRFPPQPNGYLHIGHVKSIRMNFQTAKRLHGDCYLRYDDTNPEKQTPEFIQQIERNVRWMGYVPDKVNFTSDYFEQMMYYANTLVKEGKAYVCESTQEEIQLERKEKRSNPFRDRSKEFSEKIFPYLSPNQTLRLKLDPSNPNPTLRDPIIYRFKSQPHPKTGNKYNIYPMYDFAHCISDSLEHIDYSLCSLQFQIRRQLYYKILDLLNLYKPIVWQFSRLNISGNLISKRKIKQLIDQKKIAGWDDPRLLTIRGMQRRGYTPKMLNNFVDKVNASRSGNEKVVRFQVLEKEVKKQLAKNCIKVTALKNPVKVQIVQQEGVKQIYIEKEQIDNVKSSKQLILKGLGVYETITSIQKIILKQSNKTIEELKQSETKVPILLWLHESHNAIPVTIYSSLLTQSEQFDPNSMKKETIFIQKPEKQLQALIDNENISSDEKKVILFQRIGYFLKDQKTNQWICCAKV